MVVEAFHRVLKIVYLEHKQNQRVDSLVNILMKINRDAFFNSLRKEEIGKRSHRLHEMQKRHSSATEMLQHGANVQVSDHANTWKVQSETTSDYYTVTKVLVADSACNASCMLRCTICEVCVHTFRCNCIDAVLHYTVCKHVHLLCLHLQSNASILNTLQLKAGAMDVNVDVTDTTTCSENERSTPSMAMDVDVTDTTTCSELENERSTPSMATIASNSAKGTEVMAKNTALKGL